MKLKYSVGVKFIAILLCACSLVAVAFSGIGIAFMEGYDLYAKGEMVQFFNKNMIPVSLCHDDMAFDVIVK